MQFVTDVISKDLVVLMLGVYYSCAFIFKNTSHKFNWIVGMKSLTYCNVVQISFITWGNFIFNLFETFKRTLNI